MKLILLCLVGLACASNISLESELSTSTPAGWTKGARATGDVELTFAVKQQNAAALTEAVLAVSDPRSARYGQHLSREDVDKLTEPMEESTAALQRFLSEQNLDRECKQNGNGDFVRCVVPIIDAERALGAVYHEYYHEATGTRVRRARGGYSLPKAVAQHIDFVAPVSRFPSLRRRPPASAHHQDLQSADPNAGNVPATLKQRYNVPADARAAANSTNIQACTAFLDQYYEQKDLDKFNKKYMPSNSGQVIKVVGDDGPRAGIEASLDIEYITAMGAGVASEFWTFAGAAPGNPENEPFLDWIALVGNTSDSTVPKVFSTSYGECENTVTMAYMNRIETELQKAAARGITLTFATGDNGVGADEGSCTRFCGQWPAGSPWVTGVGGTTGSTETAWDGSAGGFSDRWPIPQWQAPAVSGYKTGGTKLPAANRYNDTGRGFPDVSAQATDFTVVNGGFAIGVGGTSAACPTFSGIISLLNDARIAAGKPVLGFLNPFLYQNAAAFNDITTGDNPGCGTSGFEAAKGWDPVTGLGTPNYEKLLAAVKALP